MTDTIKYQQNIFDFCILNHGELNNIVSVLENNELQLDSDIVQGTSVEFDDSLGNAKTKEFLLFNQIVPINERQNSGNADIDYTDIVYIAPNTTDKNRYVQGGQSIFDYCLWQYGTLEQLKKLFADNSLQFDSILQQGSVLSVEDDLKTLYITNHYNENEIIPLNFENNASIVSALKFFNGDGFMFFNGDGLILN